MLKAIETEYKNTLFRSRIEARWAVFFDTLGVKWEYEKEGYDLDGTWYLPDFWLPRLDCFIEVKGAMPTCEELGKAFLLSWYSGKHVHILWGDVKEPTDDKTNAMFSLGNIQAVKEDKVYEPPLVWLKQKLADHDINPFNGKIRCIHEATTSLAEAMDLTEDTKLALWTGCNWWSACIGCKNIEIHPHGFLTRMTCGCIKEKYGWTEEDGDYRSSGCPALEKAYKSARQARFEHGESPDKLRRDINTQLNRIQRRQQERQQRKGHII